MDNDEIDYYWSGDCFNPHCDNDVSESDTGCDFCERVFCAGCIKDNLTNIGEGWIMCNECKKELILNPSAGYDLWI